MGKSWTMDSFVVRSFRVKTLNTVCPCPVFVHGQSNEPRVDNWLVIKSKFCFKFVYILTKSRVIVHKKFVLSLSY